MDVKETFRAMANSVFTGPAAKPRTVDDMEAPELRLRLRNARALLHQTVTLLQGEMLGEMRYRQDLLNDIEALAERV